MELPGAAVLHISVLLLIALSRDTLSDDVITPLNQSASCRRSMIAGFHEGYTCTVTPFYTSPMVSPFNGLDLPDDVTSLHLTFSHPVTWSETSDDAMQLGRLKLLEVDVTRVGLVPPSAFPSLPSIQQLQLLHTAPSVDRSFRIDIRPGAFGRLPGLQRLLLSDLRLPRLTSGLLEGLEALTNLDLSVNQLSEVAPEVFTQACRRLSSLQLGRNWFTSLRNISLANCSSLQRLDLYGNRISVIRKGDFPILSALKEINLAENSLESIEANSFDVLKQLDTLDLTGNSLRVIEGNGLPSRPNNLRVLYLDKNQISELHSDSFSNAIHLRTLSLKSNQIASLPTGIFSSLFLLEELDMTGNLLTSLEEETFQVTSNINRLILRDNRLDLIAPLAFQHLSKLEELDLRNNLLRSIPESSLSFSQITSNSVSTVLELSLSHNPWTCECNLHWIVLNSGIGGNNVTIQLKDTYKTLCSQPERFSGKLLTDVLSVDYCNSFSSSTNIPTIVPTTVQTTVQTTVPLFPKREEQKGHAGSTGGPVGVDGPENPRGKPESRGVNHRILIIVSVVVLAICIAVLVVVAIVRLHGKSRRTRAYSVDGGTHHDNPSPAESQVAHNSNERQLNLYAFNTS